MITEINKGLIAKFNTNNIKKFHLRNDNSIVQKIIEKRTVTYNVLTDNTGNILVEYFSDNTDDATVRGVVIKKIKQMRIDNLQEIKEILINNLKATKDPSNQVMLRQQIQNIETEINQI